MYSNIKKLVVGDKIIEVNHIVAFSNESLGEFFNQSLKCQSQDKEMNLQNCKIKFNAESRMISISSSEKILIEFYAPRELRYRIAKDIQNPDTEFAFNLNYRKHFRTKHSKSQATIQYFNFEYPEMLAKCENMKLDIRSFYERAKSFSEGEEKRPTLLIVANILDDGLDYVKFDVTFRIVKSNKVVYNKVKKDYVVDIPD